MTRRMMLLAAGLVFVIGVSGAAAHPGHTHRVMGTVAVHHENHLEVKTKEGKSVAIVLNDKTTVFRGKEKLDLAALKVGERVVVDVGDGKEPLTARVIRLGAAAATTATK
jgi:hypothetical protein